MIQLSIAFGSTAFGVVFDHLLSAFALTFFTSKQNTNPQ
ncbi:hypothetical protein SAMN03159353_1007137 [Cedecea sp. NFIX57]|nr:hypothetical protein SAMN03159353_1007137 [Cedecea sp. NFIX57]